MRDIGQVFQKCCIIITVEPLNRGHFGAVAFVLSSEVVLFSDVVMSSIYSV